MSVSAISSALASDLSTNFQKQQQEFKQLGQDLQSGNLSAAQQDFVTLQQDLQQTGSTSTTSATSTASTSAAQSSESISQLFQQLGEDLQSGNLSGAQQDFQSLQTDLQNLVSGQSQSGEAVHGHHHHHGGGGDSSDIGQLFDQLSQSLQSGDLSSAQSAFSSLQTALGLSSSNSGQSSSTASTSGISIDA